MMRVLWLSTLRWPLRRPWQALLAIVGVAMGVAVVIAKPNANVQPELVLAELKAKLANFKIPKRCFVVAELPRNTMGKVQKNLLRDQHKSLFTT